MMNQRACDITPPSPGSTWTPKAMTWSTTKKNSAASADIASTLSVVATVSFRVGQVTLANSCRTSRMNWAGEIFAIIDPSAFR